MVARLGIDVVAPRRLDPDHRIAEVHRRQHEAILGRTEEGVGLGLPPAAGDRAPHGLRQGGEEAGVVGEGERDLGGARAGVAGVGGARGEPRHQRGTVRRRALDAVAGVREGGHDARRARRRVEADSVADAPVAVRIVGEHQGDSARGRRSTCEAHPGGGEAGDEAAAFLVRLRDHDGRLRRLVEAGLGLERDRAGEDAPVDLGQRHVHGDVAGREAAGRPPPTAARWRRRRSPAAPARRSRQRGSRAARRGGRQRSRWRSARSPARWRASGR